MKTRNSIFAIAIAAITIFTAEKTYSQWSDDTDIYNTNTGEVGIGNTSPEYLLDILNSTTTRSLNLKSTYSGTQEKYGFYSNITSAGTGGRYGIYSSVDAPNANKSAHGIYSKVVHQGSGTTYGIRSYVSASGSGIHYGVHSEATGSTNYAFYGLGRGYFSDKVGIGVTSPGARLAINSTAGEKPLWVSIDGSTKFMIESNGGTSLGYSSGVMPPANGLIVNGQTAIGVGTPDSRLRVAASAGERAFWVSIDGSTKFMIEDNGGVSIGYVSAVEPPADGLAVNGVVNINNETGATGYQLSVDGKVICEELRVQNSTDWPDYVFAKEYDLKSIEEVEDFICRNNHLPGIPSASEVESGGLNVGEMQHKMMEKIEEMMLYIIELKKENQELRGLVSR